MNILMQMESIDADRINKLIFFLSVQADMNKLKINVDSIFLMKG